IVFVIAVPCGINLFGKAFEPAVVDGIITIAIPTIRTANTTVMYVNVVSDVNLVKKTVVTVIIVNPIINNHLAPIRSNTFPINGERKPITNAPGKIIIPYLSAVNPAIYWINIRKLVSAA